MRGEVPAQADPADSYPRPIDIIPAEEEIDRSPSRDLKVHAHLHAVPHLPLSGAIHSEGR
jgi:hypothetical protein